MAAWARTRWMRVLVDLESRDVRVVYPYLLIGGRLWADHLGTHARILRLVTKR